MPYRREQFFTPLSPAAVFARIAARLPDAPPHRPTDDEPWYEGDASEAAFYLRRQIGYRNSFLPEITGEVTGVSGGSVLDLRLRLQKPTLLFMACWLLAAAGLLLSTLSRAAAALGPFDWGAWSPLWFIVFGYGLTTSAFWWEAHRARRHIRVLLQAQQLSA